MLGGGVQLLDCSLNINFYHWNQKILFFYTRFLDCLAQPAHPIEMEYLDERELMLIIRNLKPNVPLHHWWIVYSIFLQLHNAASSFSAMNVNLINQLITQLIELGLILFTS